MVVYQFRPDDDLWADWKRTVPRDKSLETRLIELIEADLEGRVRPKTQEQQVDPGPEPRPNTSFEPESSEATPLEAVSFPSTVDRDTGEAAIEAAVAYLREAGEASKADFVRDVMPDHPLGYDVEKAVEQAETPGDRYRGSWWERVIKPGLEAHPDVEEPSPQASEWRYVG